MKTAWVVLTVCGMGMAQAGELDQATPVQGRVHHYRVPVEFVAPTKNKTCGVNYSTFEEGTRGQFDRLVLGVPDGRADVLTFHRRSDNGTAGSGVKFHVRYVRREVGDACTVAAQAFATEIYRQGLVGRFPVPAFALQDVETMLDEPYLKVEGEFNANYPPDVVVSKFRRAQSDGRYEVQVGGVIVPTKLTCTSAGQGARCVYAGLVEGVADNGGVIDFVQPSRDFAKALPVWVSKDVTQSVRAVDSMMAIEREQKIKTGTQVCREQDGIRTIGFTENYAPATRKIQIRLHRNSRGYALNEIIWDDPDRWRLCE